MHIVVEDSIDDRMLLLQKRKTEDTQQALNEGRSPKGLSEKEQLWLFGEKSADD